MLTAIKTFTADETATLTIDWVLLTAAFVGLGLAVMGVAPRDGIDDLANDLDALLACDASAKAVAAPGSDPAHTGRSGC